MENSKLLNDYIMEREIFTEKQAFALFKQIVLAVEYIHQDLLMCHRDVCPQNVLVDDFGFIKVKGFSKTCLLQEVSQKQHRFVLKNAFSAPELASAMDGEKVDMYSLGMVNYLCIKYFRMHFVIYAYENNIQPSNHGFEQFNCQFIG